MAGIDSRFQTWVRTIDTVAPAAVTQLDVTDSLPSAHTATVSWHAGDDPDLAAGVQGSGVDFFRSEYRYQREDDATLSDWYSADDWAASLTSVDASEVIMIDVRQYDMAGNASPVTRTWLKIPPVTAHASFAFVLAAPVFCAAGGCEGILAATAVVGAAATGWIVADNTDWDVKKNNPTDDVPVASGREADAVNGEGGQALPYADWKAKGKRERRTLRQKLGLAKGDPREAHHIIPVGDSRAEYLREILYQCGLDLNDLINGVPLSKKEHWRTYTKDYFNALDKMFHRADPDKNINPCDWLSDDSEHGLRAMLKRIKYYLENGTFPY
jgi:hypothetical protein